MEYNPNEQQAQQDQQMPQKTPVNQQPLDKCYGDSKTPLGEWMHFSTDEEE